MISADELNSRLETDASDNKFKIQAQLLLDAINDWPSHNLREPADFLNELMVEIGVPLNLERIQVYAQTLSVANDAWKMESLTSVLEIFVGNDTKTLDEIVFDINKRYLK